MTSTGKPYLKLIVCLLFLTPALTYAQTPDPYPYTLSQDSAYVRDYYQKLEAMIPMRDGVELFTQIYVPKDAETKHPILLQRTPYSCAPYGVDKFKKRIGANIYMIREKYIVVYQDVRGAVGIAGDVR